MGLGFLGFAFAAVVSACAGATAAELPLSISGFLADGREIVGYASGCDNRTWLILFCHPGVNVARPVRRPVRRDAQPGHAGQLL